MSYLCPLCSQRLEYADAAWRCEQGHQYDCAKEGYVNLLPVQFKRSKQPGDSAAMVHARRAFLDAQHYYPLQQQVSSLVEKWLLAGERVVLDIGCGEGYYTGAIAQAAQSCSEARVYGLDVSKEAIRFAAKRQKQVQFSVASSYRLPFFDDAIDLVTCIYAPYKPEELSRVVRQGGYLLTVTPGPRHLIEFKSLIYQEAKEHDADLPALTGFQLREQVTLSYSMSLNSGESVALLQMTPFAWRASPQVWQQLAATEQFTCNTDFVLRLWQKQSTPDSET